MGKVIVFAGIVVIVGIGILSLANRSGNSTNSAQQVDFFDPSPTMPPTPTRIPTPTVSPTASAKSATSSSSLGENEIATQAAIMTSKGEIVINLYRSEAPNTIKNFESKAKSGFYNNLTFHRVEDWVIQGGDPKGNGTGGGEMKTEINKKPFVVGAVGVARGGNKAISNDAQFFITKKDASWLNEEYTNFGMVKSGMDVVEKIAIGDKILNITLR